MIFAEPPVDIGRDQAAAEAAKELSKSAYRQSEGSLIERAIGKVLEWIGDLLDSLTGTSPNGHAGLAMLIGLVVLIIVVVLWRAGVLRTSHKTTQAVFDTAKPRTAGEYRAQSEQEAASGDYALAVRSRFRACVAELTERTILDERPGRTAYEVVADAGRAVPTLREPLQPAALAFTEVVYGNRPGTPERYAVVVAADDAARTARALVRA
jgi:F0F1-type ATP synthase assembly protein I